MSILDRLTRWSEPQPLQRGHTVATAILTARHGSRLAKADTVLRTRTTFALDLADQPFDQVTFVDGEHLRLWYHLTDRGRNIPLPDTVAITTVGALIEQVGGLASQLLHFNECPDYVCVELADNQSSNVPELDAVMRRFELEPGLAPVQQVH